MGETLSAIVSSARRGRGHPALHVGLAGDAPRTPPARFGLAALDRVDIGRGDARRFDRRTVDGAERAVMTLSDARLSSQHARLSRIGGAWVVEDLGSKNGTWVAGERVSRRALVDGDSILVGHTALVYRDEGGELRDVEDVPPPPHPGLATVSPELAARFAELADAARSTVPIEITGETGTGKELAARAVHALSRRAGQFVAVNCGALPATLLEGELFGHKRGAYTGAAEDRTGLVRSSDGGTLFLDEVAELPAPSQAAMLRVLQEHEVVPVGGDRPVSVDLRIVSATHRDLDAEVRAGRFRADLRARILGVKLALPPLRERREDLGHLTATLLQRIAVDRPTTFSADAVAALYACPWPLNIRELERALSAALAVARDRIELDHLRGIVRSGEPTDAVDPAALSIEDSQLRDALTAAIARHGGNLAAVARELGKDRTQIRRWMKRFGLDRDS
jgi:DNA-binding NtrC family response regulator